MNKLSLSALIFFLIPISIVVVYYPGLSGGFVLDDFSNIMHPKGTAMDELSWGELKNAALSMDGRPLARATFGLNYLTTGFNPLYFKLVNLLIHCINAWLVFFLAFNIFSALNKHKVNRTHQRQVILVALGISLAWALHPINLTNILYSVQRMNSLSALFVLAGMICYMLGRTRLDTQPVKAWLLILSPAILFLPLALLCKENGALLPLFLFILELTIFRFSAVNDRQTKALYLYFFFVLFLPAVLVVIYIFQHPAIFQTGYSNRHFDVVERLLTETRVLWRYIQMVILPTPSIFGIFQDDIRVSTSLLTPVTTIFSIIGLAGLFGIGLFSNKRAPIISFGILFFFAGHLMESTFMPLELAYEHRNYLPALGMLLPLLYFLGFSENASKYKIAKLTAFILIILLLGSQTHLRAWTWSDNERLYLTNVLHHPHSPRANYEAGKIFGQRLEQGIGNPTSNYQEAIRLFERNAALRGNTTSGLFGSILASLDSGHDIKKYWIDELEDRLANQPLEQVNLLWLNKLTDCVSSGKCPKDELRIPALLEAALSYPGINSKNKSLLYAIAAKFAYEVDRDQQLVINMAQKAVLNMPSNLVHHLNLVSYLIWVDNLAVARIALEKLTSLDVNNQYSAEIYKLSSFLQHKQMK